MILFYGQANRNHHETAISTNNEKFCAKDVSKCGRLFVKTEDLHIQVLGSSAVQPKQSVSTTADAVCTGDSTFH